MPTENERRAIAHLQLVLADANAKYWPDDIRALERAVQILQRTGR
jgi:hypothetical protein